MLRRLVFIGCAGVIFPALLLAQPSSDQQLFKDAQVLLNCRKETEAMALYEKALTREPNHFQVLCEAVVLKTKIAARLKDHNQKRDQFLAAKAYAEKAYQLKPQDAMANYVMALGVGGAALVGTTKDKLAASFEMKRYLDRALQLNPRHAPSWYLLGRWNDKISNLNFAEVAAARVMYNGVPKGASVDNAVDCLRKAIQYDPDNILFYYDLARIYDELEEDEEVIKLLEKALTLKVVTADEIEVRRRCKKLLDSFDE